MSEKKQKVNEEAAVQAAPGMDEQQPVEQTPNQAAPIVDEQPSMEQAPEAAAPVVNEQPTMDEPIETAVTSTDEQQIPMVVSLPVSQVLNLREGPSREFRVLEQIPAQTEVQAVPMPYGVQVPGWQLIRLEDRVGWAAADYLQPVEGD